MKATALVIMNTNANLALKMSGEYIRCIKGLSGFFLTNQNTNATGLH